MCLKAHWFSASICTESQNAISPTVLPPSNLPHPGYHQTHLHDHNKNLPDHHNPAHRTYLFCHYSCWYFHGKFFSPDVVDETNSTTLLTRPFLQTAMNFFAPLLLYHIYLY